MNIEKNSLEIMDNCNLIIPPQPQITFLTVHNQRENN